ncbi:MAG: PqqD family protein [Acidobacteriota bacterium]
MTDTTRLFHLKSDVRYRSIADEGIVLLQDEGEVLVVNGVGVRIVELIGEGTTLPQILDTLEAEYDVEPTQLKTDVNTYLAELEDAGVLEPVD